MTDYRMGGYNGSKFIRRLGVAMHEQIQECEVETAIFTKLDFTDDDEVYRSYMVRGWLEAFCVLDYQTGNWYINESISPTEYADQLPGVIERLLDAEDAPSGIFSWWMCH